MENWCSNSFTLFPKIYQPLSNTSLKECRKNVYGSKDLYEETKKNIIIQNDKKEDSLRWNDNDDEFYKKIQEEYWFIDNIQKPLKAPSAYSLKDLQDICNKLHIELHVMVNDKQKQKTKTKLYEEILQNI